jgi:trimeric autotransporter adhesin
MVMAGERLRGISSGMTKFRQITILMSAAVTAALLLSSCGGFFPSADTIVSLTLSPTTAYVLPQGTQQFTATATYGNNTTGDVTSQVAWTSSATNIATVNSSGLVTGVAVGSSTLTAKANNSSVTATAVITVSNKTIRSISVSPASQTLLLSTGQTQQFTAQATYSDGSFGDVTSSASWNSSNTSVATISSTGLAQPIGTGSTTISAALGGQVGTASLTVQ